MTYQVLLGWPSKVPWLFHSVAILILLCLTPRAKSLDHSQCIAPLGMETGDIKDSAISASSSFEDSTVGPHNARVRVDQHGGAWCPKNMIEKETKEWLEIDLGSVHSLTAVESQGRFGNGQGVEFTEAYVIEYYRPRLRKWVRYRTKKEKEVLDANTNTYLAVKNELNPVILAQKIRFHPFSNFKRTICMRVEVYGCSYHEGVVSYSMPQGDERGNEYHFYDWTYDGDRIGNRLINGLGCLTDGDHGPDDFKLNYYAKDRGWVGWKKSSAREMIEIEFEFDDVREFHHVHIYTNNQFTREVAVFKEAKVMFSIGGSIFPGDPAIFVPIEDRIFEQPRNVSVKLHRRVGKYVKIQLYFASKWIMISEVAFESSLARGNYTQEVEGEDDDDDGEGESDAEKEGLLDSTIIMNIDKTHDMAGASGTNRQLNEETIGLVGDQASGTTTKEASGSALNPNDESAFMPIIIGVLTVVILVLTAVIFLIVRHRKQNSDPDGLAAKMALHYPEAHPLTYAGPSDTGSSGSSGRQVPFSGPPQYRDEPCSAPHSHLIAPAHSIRFSNSPTHKLYSVANRDGSLHSAASPLGSRRLFPPVPRLQVPPPPTSQPPPSLKKEAVYSEPATYTEPFQSVRHSPYYGYGFCGDFDDTLIKQSLLSDASGGDYAVPIPPRHTRTSTGSSSTTPSSGSRYSSSSQLPKPSPSHRERHQQQQQQQQQQQLQTTHHSRLPSNTMEEEVHNPQRLLASKLQSHLVPGITTSHLSLRQRLSEGAFGTVWIADAHGLPEYGQPLAEVDSRSKTLVAVKFLSDSASQTEKTEFIQDARLLSALDDPNIARVLGLCTTQDPHFVALEYLELNDLNQFLRSHLPDTLAHIPSGTRTLSFGTLLHFCSQIASGMRYMEALNFVHRDLATRNCVVGRGHHVKIGDIGRDNPIYDRDYVDMDNHLVPIRWMAWESIVGGKYTMKSDVWSFGVVLWEILQFASIRPYATLDDTQVMEELHALRKSERMQNRLEQPPNCPKDLYELMCECWKQDATSRPSFREIHLFLQRKNLGYPGSTTATVPSSARAGESGVGPQNLSSVSSGSFPMTPRGIDNPERHKDSVDGHDFAEARNK